MLVLTRKTQQQIQIGPHITITILKVKGQSIRIGIDAPREVAVLRAELADKIADEGDTATVKAARAASHRERQRSAVAIEAVPAELALGGKVSAAEVVAPLSGVLMCRATRPAGMPRLGTRNRRRLLALSTAAGVQS